MFWRERERESREQNGGPLCGQIRVLVVGDSGVGKTSLVHLIMNGHSISRPSQTIGCSVSVKHMKYGSSGSSSSISKGGAERDFFVELWDISGHDRYKDRRSLFYSQINGVIFVYDLSQRKTKIDLIKWASEIAATGTFSAPMGSAGPGGLSVLYIVIKNKADIATKEGARVSSGNLVDMARHWVEKQGLLPPSEELPLVKSFPGSGTLLAAAKEARYDKEAVTKFFRMMNCHLLSLHLGLYHTYKDLTIVWMRLQLKKASSTEIPVQVGIHTSTICILPSQLNTASLLLRPFTLSGQ